MSIVKFNVGGKEYAISRDLLHKSPTLTALCSYKEDGGPIFLDHNYEAFAIALDFLRYNRVLVPPSINPKTVEFILDDLGVSLDHRDRESLSTATYQIAPNSFGDEPLPQYTPLPIDKKSPLTAGSSDTTNPVDQFVITVEQKIADLIMGTIRPRITSQALQGAYKTTYVLLPEHVKSGVLMSEFPQSNFTEMVYLEKDVERFLRQPEVMRRFEGELKKNLEVLMTFERKDVFLRSENDFGIYGTTTIEALVIEFTLGRREVFK